MNTIHQLKLTPMKIFIQVKADISIYIGDSMKNYAHMNMELHTGNTFFSYHVFSPYIAQDED